VIGIDILDYRLEKARNCANSETLNASKVNVVESLRDITEGRGVDVCIDAVGMEADRNIGDKIEELFLAEVGTSKVIDLCASSVRRGGTISIVGVYASRYKFPLGQLFDKGITLKMGQAHVQKYIDELLQLVYQKKIILDDVISHTLPLEQAPYAYNIFNKKEDQCVKVVLKP